MDNNTNNDAINTPVTKPADEKYKINIGGKFIDPEDRRMHLPHSRIVPPFKGQSASGSLNNNGGGLLQVEGHRPAISSSPSKPPTDHTPQSNNSTD